MLCAPQNRAAALRADEPSGGLQHAGGCQSSTLLVERLNHTIRQHVATLGRRVTTVCKGADGLRQQLRLPYVRLFLLARASLCVPLAEFEPTNGMGSARQWRTRMPTIAGGLADWVWTLGKMLMCRVPLCPQSQALYAVIKNDARETVGERSVRNRAKQDEHMP
jgi:hypothetical protein